VGDGQAGPAGGDLLDGAAQADLEGGVDGAGRLVEHEQVGVDEPGARQRDELPLTRRQPAAPLPHGRVEAGGQRVQPAGEAELVERGAQPRRRRAGGGEGDVVADGAVEEEPVLRDVGDPLPQVGARDAGQRDTADEDTPLVGVDEAGHQPHERRLARPGPADHRDTFARCDLHVEVVQHPRPRRIGVRDPVEPHAERAGRQRGRTCRLRDGVGGVEDAEDATHARSGRLGVVEDLDEHLDRLDEQRHEEQERDERPGTEPSARPCHHADDDHHRGDRRREHLGAREQDGAEPPDPELRAELHVEGRPGAAAGARLGPVGAHDGKAGDDLAHRRQRLGVAGPDPVVGAAEHPLEHVEQQRVGDGRGDDEDGEQGVEDEHHDEHQHDLGDPDEDADPTPLDELRDGLDVARDAGDERAAPVPAGLDHGEAVQLAERGDAQFGEPVSGGADEPEHRPPGREPGDDGRGDRDRTDDEDLLADGCAALEDPVDELLDGEGHEQVSGGADDGEQRGEAEPARQRRRDAGGAQQVPDDGTAAVGGGGGGVDGRAHAVPPPATSPARRARSSS